jgi:CDP-diacylglycerol--serine O-phosphatidyltransferase
MKNKKILKNNVPQKRKKRSIIPNILTMGNMLMGFYAIIMASRGDAKSLAIAGFLVFCGAIFDAMDGAVARALHVESPIGLQLDSLADGVAYGIAPGIISYQAFLSGMPVIFPGFNLGMVIAAIFPICAIYRLARFNVCTDEHKGFLGIPSPAAGVFISAIPALPFSNIIFAGTFNFTLPLSAFIFLFIITALLMVSSFNYNKIFSDIYYKSKPLSIVVYVLCFLSFIIFKLWAVFIVTGIYIAAGIIRYAMSRVPKKKKRP